jgi:hypothetical protein
MLFDYELLITALLEFDLHHHDSPAISSGNLTPPEKDVCRSGKTAQQVLGLAPK